MLADSSTTTVTGGLQRSSLAHEVPYEVVLRLHKDFVHLYIIQKAPFNAHMPEHLHGITDTGPPVQSGIVHLVGSVGSNFVLDVSRRIMSPR